eukprot:5252168-Lingulodinium_polyedra.AAC.1
MVQLLRSVEVGQAPEADEIPPDLADVPKLVKDISLGLCRVKPHAYVCLLDGVLRPPSLPL